MFGIMSIILAIQLILNNFIDLGSADNYRITTECSFVDFLFAPLMLLTVTTRTVTVER